MPRHNGQSRNRKVRPQHGDVLAMRQREATRRVRRIVAAQRHPNRSVSKETYRAV